MPENIVMIHGMFQAGKCWANYRRFFEDKGYACLPPTLRHHDIDPTDSPPPELGTTSLLDFAADHAPCILGEPGGEQVAGAVADWLEQTLACAPQKEQE